MTEGARTAVPYTKAKAKGRAEGGYRMRQQLEALRGRAGTPQAARRRTLRVRKEP
jgi:hypothetical protein